MGRLLSNWMNDFLKDRLKEVLSAGLSAATPAGVWKWSNMFPFINPQIPADLGLLPLAAAVIIVLFVCYYTREPRPPNPPTRASKLLARRYSGDDFGKRIYDLPLKPNGTH